MPVSPYTEPIQFEYKPLNLAAFAVPLAQMQEKFDVTQALINESDVDLTHLDFGTDPVKAAELKETYRQKRDELAKNLVESGNYTQAATKLKELNRLWQTDPERKALEYNYAARQKYMEEQQKRIDSGKDDQITRDQYYQDIARKDREYAGGQGTYWQHDPNLEKGKYNLYGTKARLSDLEKELEDMTWKVANAVDADKRAGALREIGIDPDLMDKKFAQTVIEERDPNKVAAAVSGYLKTLPRFRNWTLDKADYDYEELKATNPEGYAEKVNSLTNNALKSINSQIAQIEKESNKKGQKGLLNSDEYKQLLAYKDEIESSKATGEFDEPLIKGLYNQEALNKVYDMTALGKVFAYKKIDTDYTFRDIYIPKGSGDGSGGDDPLAAGLAGFAPTEYSALNLNTLVQQRVDAAKSMLPNITATNNVAGGNFRTLVQGWKGSTYRNNMEKNRGLQRERQETIYNVAARVIADGGNAKDFQRALWNAGIKEGNNEKTAGAVFSALSGNNGNTLNYVKEQLDNSKNAFMNWSDAKSQEKAIDKKITGIPEFRNYVGEFERDNYVVVSDKEFAELKKLGLGKNAQNQEIYNQSKEFGDRVTYQKKVPVSDYVRLLKDNKGNKIKNLQEALDKGINLSNVKIVNNTWGGAVNLKDYPSIISAIQPKKQEIIDKHLQGENMSFRYVGDKKVDKALNAEFLTAKDLSSFVPSTTLDWSKVKGFDEDGKMLPGTSLMLTDKQAVKIVKKGNRMLLEIPYKFNNEDDGKGETSVLVDFKKGTEEKQQTLINHITWLTSQSKDTDPYANETYNTAKAMQFDVLTGSNLNENAVKIIDVEEGESSIVKTVSTGKSGVNLQIVKEGVKGRPPVLAVKVVGGGTNAYLTKNGKKFTANVEDLEEVKVFAAENLWGEK
jgi:hypothetical protein